MMIRKATQAPFQRARCGAQRDRLLSMTFLLHVIFATPQICLAASRQDCGNSFVISERVGQEIDPQEREEFHLFPHLDGFTSACAVMTRDSTMELRIARTIGEVSEDITYVLSRRQKDELYYYIDNYEEIVAGEVQPRWYLLGDLVDGHHAVESTREQSRTPGSVQSSSGWFSLGIGATSQGLLIGCGYTTHITSNTLLTIRYARTDEITLWASPSERVWDLGALVGIGSVGKNGGAAVSIGLGLVGGVRRGERIGGGWFSSKCEALEFSTIGIPVELQFIFRASSLGIGVNTYANLNPEKSFAGAALSLLISE